MGQRIPGGQPQPTGGSEQPKGQITAVVEDVSQGMLLLQQALNQGGAPEEAIQAMDESIKLFQTALNLVSSAVGKRGTGPEQGAPTPEAGANPNAQPMSQGR